MLHFIYIDVCKCLYMYIYLVTWIQGLHAKSQVVKDVAPAHKPT